MLEAYSTNIEVGEGDGTVASPEIPFNNVNTKGVTVVLTAPATFQFNCCGRYKLTCDASAECSGDVGDIIIQLDKDNVLQPQAQSTATPSSGTALVALGFSTQVTVGENNRPNCMCSTPTVCKIRNLGEGAIFKNINVTIEKLGR